MKVYNFIHKKKFESILATRRKLMISVLSLNGILSDSSISERRRRLSSELLPHGRLINDNLINSAVFDGLGLSSGTICVWMRIDISKSQGSLYVFSLCAGKIKNTVYYETPRINKASCSDHKNIGKSSRSVEWFLFARQRFYFYSLFY